MRVLAVGIAAMALLGGVPAHAFAAPSQGERANITFGAAPANSKRPDGTTAFTFDSSPGGQISSHLAVLNLTGHRETLRVYAVDVRSGADGGYFYPPRSAAPVAAGTWITITTPHSGGLIHARPRSTMILPLHLSVPSNASPGDHVAAVVVSLTGRVDGKSGQRVHLEQRIATRALIRVSGTLHPQLRIDNLQARYAGHLNPAVGGVVTVTYTVRNTGNAILGGAQQVSVHGLLGTTTLATNIPAIPALLPGGSFAVTAHVPDVFPELRLTANVRVTPLGLAGDDDPGLTPITATAHVWAIPWLLLAVVFGLLLFVAGHMVRRRHNGRASCAVDAVVPSEHLPQGAIT